MYSVRVVRNRAPLQNSIGQIEARSGTDGPESERNHVPQPIAEWGPQIDGRRDQRGFGVRRRALFGQGMSQNDGRRGPRAF